MGEHCFAYRHHENLCQPTAPYHPLLDFCAPEHNRAKDDADQKLGGCERRGVENVAEEGHVYRSRLQNDGQQDCAQQQLVTCKAD